MSCGQGRTAHLLLSGLSGCYPEQSSSVLYIPSADHISSTAPQTMSEREDRGKDIFDWSFVQYKPTAQSAKEKAVQFQLVINLELSTICGYQDSSDVIFMNKVTELTLQ